MQAASLNRLLDQLSELVKVYPPAEKEASRLCNLADTVSARTAEVGAERILHKISYRAAFARAKSVMIYLACPHCWIPCGTMLPRESILL